MNIPRLTHLFILCIIFTAPSALAHEDTFIGLDGTKLTGLPSQFAPAELDIKDSSFRIKNHRMHFAPYIQAFFTDHEKYDLKITASWYHDLSELPPYIDIHIYPSQKDYHYELLFNLNTLEVIKLTVVAQIDKDTIRDFDVALTDGQKKDIHDSIAEAK